MNIEAIFNGTSKPQAAKKPVKKTVPVKRLGLKKSNTKATVDYTEVNKPIVQAPPEKKHVSPNYGPKTGDYVQIKKGTGNMVNGDKAIFRVMNVIEDTAEIMCIENKGFTIKADGDTKEFHAPKLCTVRYEKDCLKGARYKICTNNLFGVSYSEVFISDQPTKPTIQETAKKAKVKVIDKLKPVVVTVEKEKTSLLTIHEGTHTKHGYEIFTVSINEWINRTKFNALNREAKEKSGRYSPYTKNGAIRGFIFRLRENAEEFVSLVCGNGSKKEIKKENNRYSFPVNFSYYNTNKLSN